MGAAAPDAAGAMAARYREPAPAIAWNDVLATMLAHRSVRAYRPDPLPPGTLETLVAAAQSASTSSNVQAWSVVAVEDAARRGRLCTLVGGQAYVAEVPLFLVFLADLSRVARMAGQPLEGLDYLEPALIGFVDAALAAQNAALAAESLGLGTCYIGNIRNHPEAVAAELGLPPRVIGVFGLCVGYADPARATGVKPRLPQTAVLHREQYDGGDAAAIARYDGHLAAFQAEQSMKVVGWSGNTVARLADAAALRGRDRMRAAMAALGFALR